MPAGRVDTVIVLLPKLRRNYLLHLGDRDDRQLLDEQKEPHREPAEASGENRVVNPRRAIARPLPWLELVRQRRHDDDEALEPHAEVDEERQDEQPRRVPAPALPEERQRENHVARVENDGCPPPLSPDAIGEERLL